jgi:hypothetical protein
VAESPEKTEIRRVSKAIFGNRHKLEVLAAIARGDQHFYVQGVADDTGIASQTVRPIVADLVDVVVNPLPKAGSPTAPHFHERVDHPVWKVSADLFEAVRELAEVGASRSR